MSVKVLGPAEPGFSLGSNDYGPTPGLNGGLAQPYGGQVNFGSPSELASQGREVTFGKAGAGHSPGGVQGANEEDLMALVRDLVQQILQMIAQRLQQNQNDTGASSQDQSKGREVGKATAPAAGSPEQPSVASGPAVTPETDPQKVTSANPASSDGPTAGSGPRAFNITNTQDHPIKIGQFDKNEQLTAELTLEPGQTGVMRFEDDTTGLLKQADADGHYRPDASRLEFFNGFINTSDIDGRNASIHATDNKGFEIGDNKSIADAAPSNIVTTDSAGNKTIAGFYDGSTETMNKGGQFMTEKLGTGMTYMHPDDDRLPTGQNPMRHTDSMTLDVTFGKP